MPSAFVAPPVIGTDGWTSSPYAWVYASATTFTIANVDLTAVYTKGTRLKCTNTGTKYWTVVGSSFSTNTTVTIATSADYVVANAAITVPQFSYQTPADFPLVQNWTPGFTGFSANPSSLVCKFWIIGNEVTVDYYAGAAGTSNATTFTITGLPVATGDSNSHYDLGHWADNGAINAAAGPADGSLATTVLTVSKGPDAAGGWTASGAKNVYHWTISYRY